MNIPAFTNYVKRKNKIKLLRAYCKKSAFIVSYLIKSLMKETVEKIEKIGVMGGSFDPVHFAHLAIAELAAEQLNLDKVIFIPAWIAPHKLDKAGNAKHAARRLEMLKLATADNEKFEVSEIEIQRKGPSYTIDTLYQLREKYHGEFFLIIGSDNYLTFDTWRAPEKILELASLVVYDRPGSDIGIEDISTPYFLLEGPKLDITSTDLRERIYEKKSIRYFLPETVRKYIYENNLYNCNEE